jgi:oxygen-independent coproporphyrinogen III oxidase
MSNYQIQLPDKTLSISSEMLLKYDKMGPRYTSYPTAPIWTADFSQQEWKNAVSKSNAKGEDLSLYFHIPFCRSACNYCACNFVVSPNNAIAEPYLLALENEIKSVAKYLDAKRKVSQLHYGGGTPTFLNTAQLQKLYDLIQGSFNLSQAADAEISIEIDPRVTSREQLALLRKLGFNRVSMGVQDFDTQVQEAVNRVQSFEMVKALVEDCHELGYESVNFDLIYGLPLQTLDSFKNTLDKVLELSPDRIALFNYAHLPSLRPFQKAHIKESDLPTRDTKLQIFCESMKSFTQSGYEYIGMDHFAKKQDELTLAKSKRTLHRNFQGYTTKAGLDLLGFGMTSISSISNAYSQNEKKLNRYLEFFKTERHDSEDLLPIEKGLTCSMDDMIRRDVIAKLLCHEVLYFAEVSSAYGIDFAKYFASELAALPGFVDDGLLELHPDKIRITALGKIFMRNIAMVFDTYLKKSSNMLFSRTV